MAHDHEKEPRIGTGELAILLVTVLAAVLLIAGVILHASHGPIALGPR